MDVISSRAFVCFLALLALVFAIVSPPVEAQSSASSPAPAPVSDGRLFLSLLFHQIYVWSSSAFLHFFSFSSF